MLLTISRFDRVVLKQGSEPLKVPWQTVIAANIKINNE
jgi:hypothetical protein